VRRVESHIRRANLSVQNRARRAEGDREHLAFLVSPCLDDVLERLLEPIARLGRVDGTLVLGVTE